MKKFWGGFIFFLCFWPLAYSYETWAQDEIRLGSIFPLSGPMAHEGTECFRGVEVAVEAQNEKGGVLGKRIKLISGDAPDAKSGTGEAERMITVEKVKLLMGTFASSISFSSSEVADRYKTPYFELISISDPITERGFKYLWRISPRASDFARMAVDFTKEVTCPALKISPEKLRIAIAHEDTLYGTTTIKFVEKFLPEAGFKNVVVKEAYSSKSVDLSSLIMKMKGAKPDVFMVVSYAPDAILMVRQAKGLDFNVKAWQGFGAGYGQPSFVEALGKDADYVTNIEYSPIYINKEAVPGLDDFMKKYQKKYGEPLKGVYPQTTYMGAMITFDIISRAGSLDAEAIAQAAWKTEVQTWTTACGWGAKFVGPGQPHPGQNTRSFPYLTQWKDKKQQVIWPVKARYADPILPIPPWKERGK